MAEDNTIDKELLNKTWYQASLWTAIIAGVFILVVAGLIMANYFLGQVSDPINSEELTKLKADIFRQPKNEEMKEQMRQLDLRMREEYFRRREFSRLGSYLLIGGVVVFLVSAKYAFDYKKELPMSTPLQQAIESRSFRFARWAVGSFGLAIGIGGVILIVLNTRYSVLDVKYPMEVGGGQRAEDGEQGAEGGEQGAGGEEQKAEGEEQGAEGEEQRAEGGEENQDLSILAQEANLTPPAPTSTDPKKNWSRFRGPGGLGISAYTNVPTSWNGKTGTGIKWKSPIVLPGKNSPVVWGNRIFLTGATEKQRAVYCFDSNSGKLLWQKAVENVPSSSPEPPEVSDDTGYAAPTVATDGQRVYAIFANGDLIGLDFNGKQLWAQNVGPFDNVYGYSSSLLTYQNLLIVLLDQGGTDDGISNIVAIDGATGKNVWKTPRPVGNSWATPILINTGSREEIITCGNPYVIAYDPKTGKELWKAKCLSGDVAPSPVFGGGLVFATNAYVTLAAIRPGGTGDVTATNIVWEADDGLPDITSPLTDGKLVYLIETYGLMTCYDAKTGELVWENDMNDSFNASPSLVGDKIYLVSMEGVTIIIGAGREFKEIGRNELGEKVEACPAFADGRIYIRGEENLYCIGEP